jgi:hypothetical protein
MVVQAAVPIPVKGTLMLIELTLEPVAAGTKLSQIFARATGPIHGRTMANIIFKGMSKQAQIDIDNFARHIENDLAGRGEVPESAAPSPENVVEAARSSLTPAEG